LLSLTAALLSDVQAYIRRYLSNLALEQNSNVAFPLSYEVKHHPAQEVQARYGNPFQRLLAEVMLQ
jgi:hypothetical protein